MVILNSYNLVREMVLKANAETAGALLALDRLSSLLVVQQGRKGVGNRSARAGAIKGCFKNSKNLFRAGRGSLSGCRKQVARLNAKSIG